MNLNVLVAVVLAAAASGGGKNSDGTVNPYTLQDAAVATGDGNYVAVNAGVGTTFVLDVTITATATVTVEVSNDNSSWQTIGAVRLTTGAIVSTITASGGYQVPASGWNYLRARISAYTSGSVTVKAQRSLFAMVFKSSTVASGDMPDPYVPTDGTMDITGGITFTGTIVSANMPDPYTPVDGAANITGALEVSSYVQAASCAYIDSAGGAGARILATGSCVDMIFRLNTSGVDFEFRDVSENVLARITDDGTTGTLTTAVIDAGSNSNITITNQAADTATVTGVLIIGGGSELRFQDTNVAIAESGTNDMDLTADGAIVATLSGGSVTVKTDFGCAVQSVSQSGADTLTPASCYIEIDCSNAGGCAQTFSETGAVEGEFVLIKNLASSTGVVTVADSAGVQLVAGASISLGDDDIVWFVYDGTAWNQATAVLAIE